jgi:hypothetical protein
MFLRSGWSIVRSASLAKESSQKKTVTTPLKFRLGVNKVSPQTLQTALVHIKSLLPFSSNKDLSSYRVDNHWPLSEYTYKGSQNFWVSRSHDSINSILVTCELRNYVVWLQIVCKLLSCKHTWLIECEMNNNHWFRPWIWCLD